MKWILVQLQVLYLSRGAFHGNHRAFFAARAQTGPSLSFGMCGGIIESFRQGVTPWLASESCRLSVLLLCSSLGSKLSRPKVGRKVLAIRHCRHWGSNPGALSLVFSRPGACWRESTSRGLSKATSSICDQAPDHCLCCEQYSINLCELGCWLLCRDCAARHHALVSLNDWFWNFNSLVPSSCLGSAESIPWPCMWPT